MSHINPFTRGGGYVGGNRTMPSQRRATPKQGPMTANQRGYLRTLLLDKAQLQLDTGTSKFACLEHADDYLDNWLAELGTDEVHGSARASKHIDETKAWLQAKRAELRGARQADAAAVSPENASSGSANRSENDPVPATVSGSQEPANPAPVTAPVNTGLGEHLDRAVPLELEDGMYELPTGGVGQPRIVKVVHAVHGSGKQYAKLLHFDTGQFVYAPGLIHDVRRAGTKLTLERARHLGAIYGVCVNCGATLTDEISIALSIGPVCGARLGGAEFKDLVRITRAQLKAARVLADTEPADMDTTG